MHDLVPSINSEGTIAARSDFSPAVLRSSLSVQNLSTGIAIVSLPAGVAPELLGESKRLFDAIKRSPSGRPHVDGWIIEEIFQRGAQVVCALDDGKVVGVAHYHKSQPRAVLVRGMAVAYTHSGMKLGTALAAMAIVHAPIVFRDVDEYECSVRVLSDGTPNMPSVNSFSRLGFVEDEDVRIAYLDGSHHNRDKLVTAEFDDKGPFIRYRGLKSTVATHSKAVEFLQRWSAEILPFSLHR